MNLPIPTNQPITGEPPSVTLLARHLPEAIPHDTVSRLFSHYGASSVRPCSHGRMKNCAFLDFSNEVLASQAQRQLHGLRFLGKVLSVERANEVTEDRKREHGETKMGKDASSLMNNAASAQKLAANVLGGEPIAEKLGVNYPFPPHLEYAYPPPDGHILTNIVNSLIAVPRFYTQVLHLMNKMNIPAPFRKALPTPPLPLSVPIPPYQPPLPPPPPPLSSENKAEDLSGSESEMESSDEEIHGEAGPRRKRVKRPAIVGPGVDKDVAHEAVGLKPVSLVPKEKPIIKKNNSILQIKIAPKPVHPEQKDNEDLTDLQGSNVEDPDHRPYATIEELNSGRLPPEEILSRPMFKNYTVGDPNANLYIKNLAKDVVVDDFYYIFGSFFGSVDAAKSYLSIKLMQEGRMRGQAFVTFPTVELAHNALSTVNGYVFKGKPMVIQFSRPKNQN